MKKGKNINLRKVIRFTTDVLYETSLLCAWKLLSSPSANLSSPSKPQLYAERHFGILPQNSGIMKIIHPQNRKGKQLLIQTWSYFNLPDVEGGTQMA